MRHRFPDRRGPVGVQSVPVCLPAGRSVSICGWRFSIDAGSRRAGEYHLPDYRAPSYQHAGPRGRRGTEATGAERDGTPDAGPTTRTRAGRWSRCYLTRHLLTDNVASTAKASTPAAASGSWRYFKPGRGPHIPW